MPLFGDEIAATRRATRTALFASLFLLNITEIQYLKEIPLKHIIQFINFLQILFILFIIFYLRRNSSLFSLILILLITFLLRFIIKDGVHHPPLNHLSSSIFISFFGLNHFIIRLSYLVPFWFFLISMYKLVNNYLNNTTSMLFILSISTFPFLLIASVTPDHSFWSSLIFIFLLSYLFLEDKINYRFCIIIISLGILFRISVFSSFALVSLIFIGDLIRKKFQFLSKINFLVYEQKVIFILMVFLPLFLVSTEGTPAFEGIEKLNPFLIFHEAIKSKIIIYSLIKQIPIWYYPFAFLIFFSKKRIEFIFFFIINLIIYFSIKPDLWGNAKYVLEYGLPFVILGQLIFTKYYVDKKKIILINVISIIIIFFNVYEVYKFPLSRISSDKIYDNGYSKSFKSKDKNTKYLLKVPYAYDDAFEYIKSINKQNNTILLGTTYGFLPEILENYNYNNLLNVINLRNNFDNIDKPKNSLSKKITNLHEKKGLKETFSEYLKIMKKTNIVKSNKSNENTNLSSIQNEINLFSNLYNIKNLDYILLADFGDRKNIKNILINNNWNLEKEFIEKRYRSTILLFKKN